MNLLHDIPAGSADEMNVIIEIPRYSKNKYEVDKETGLIALDRVMHTSQDYPFDYGFVPQTLFDDGERDDKIIAVPVDDPRFDEILDLENVNKHWIKEMDHFFKTYKNIQKKEVEILDFEGKEKAKEAFEKSIKMYQEDKNK